MTKKLTHKTKIKPKKKPIAATSITLPSKYKEPCKILAPEYGSIKAVFEHAVRKYLNINKVDETQKKGYKWRFSLIIPEDIREEIEKRIPGEFMTLNQAYTHCLIMFLEERREMNNE